MTFKQGDVVLINFDPVIGHKQAGLRPALVISRELFNRNTNQLIVCPLTTKEKRFPTRIPFTDKNKKNGFIICDYVKTIDIEARKPKFLERLDESTLNKVLAVVYSFIEKEKEENEL